jgi:hypothetical protein
LALWSRSLVKSIQFNSHLHFEFNQIN